jgi:hypothetical protein
MKRLAIITLPLLLLYSHLLAAENNETLPEDLVGAWLLTKVEAADGTVEESTPFHPSAIPSTATSSAPPQKQIPSNCNDYV